ncbi:MAG: hypothetical protein ACLP9L_11875 [Thermoguttaceae bacterium]
MTEPQKTDHWAALASNLGAEPVLEELKESGSAETPEASAQVQATQSAPPPPVFRPAAKPVSTARRPAHPSAWDQLAGDLGITPPPQPVASTAPPASVPTSAGPRSAVLPFAELPNEIVDIEIEEAEAALPVWADLEPAATEPESFEPQEALDIMDDTADEFGDEASDADTATSESDGERSASEHSANEESATEERRSRRRRRRRGRGRGREDAPAEEAGSGNESNEEPTDDNVIFSGSLESDDDSPLAEPAEEDRPEGERTERRGRRRRRGRSRGRDQVRGEETVGEEDSGDDHELDFDGAEEESTVNAEAMDEHDFDGDEDHDEDGGESPRIGFRNIPSWQDAIGMMIAKNMESRSRNPGGQRGPSGRGGRGGGGRGRGRRPDRR